MIPAFRKVCLVSACALILAVASCNKQRAEQCTLYAEQTGQHHLVDLGILSGAPELLKVLEGNPQLQVYRAMNNESGYVMHCHVFYKGLKIFTDYFSVFKNKINNGVHYSGTVVDSIDISLTPGITYQEAIAIAKTRQQFHYSAAVLPATCIEYRLGIYDLNALRTLPGKNYKLVWNIEGPNEYPVVVVDAQDGQVYYDFDGSME